MKTENNISKDICPIMVSIKCTAYNHEKFIRDTLEGFVMQKTNFRFEAIVHDDASTDGTAAIIREYAEKYPDIIKPIYETENQYSKHDGTLTRIINEACTGKYIALCEGDDHWIDANKLQMQVDVMEGQADISLCYTRNESYSVAQNKVVGIRGIDCVDFRTFLLHDETITPTVMMRKVQYEQYLNEIQPGNKGWLMGDTPLWLWMAKNGKVEPIDVVTARYNAHEGSASRMGTFEKQKRFNKSALDIRLFFIHKYKDCEDLIPYEWNKYYRSTMNDAYNNGCVFPFLKYFFLVKNKTKFDYRQFLLILPKSIMVKLKK